MKKLGFILNAVFFIIVFTTLSYADTPKLINYQAFLTDTAGKPLTGTVSVIFKVWDAETGGNALWTEVQNIVEVTNGTFSILLGSATLGGIPVSVFNSPDRWLGISVEGDNEMSPRHQLVSVPYAYNAASAAVISSPGGSIAGPEAPPGVLHMHYGIVDVTDTPVVVPVTFSNADYTIVASENEEWAAGVEITIDNHTANSFEIWMNFSGFSVPVHWIAIGQ